MESHWKKWQLVFWIDLPKGNLLSGDRRTIIFLLQIFSVKLTSLPGILWVVDQLDKLIGLQERINSSMCLGILRAQVISGWKLQDLHKEDKMH